MGITAELKVKRQKNGNVHEYIYYRCTRKSKTTKCAAPFIREEKLANQLSSLLQTVSLRSDWAEKMLTKLDTEQTETAQSMTACVQETKQQISTISDKLQRLLDSYLDQDIEREVYVENKANLMSNKKTLEGNISSLQQQQSTRLEPMREWIKTASELHGIAAAADPIPKRDAIRQVFGSNLTLTNRLVSAEALTPWAFAADPEFCFSCERGTGFEPATSSLEERHSTTELPPHRPGISISLFVFFGKIGPHFG